MKINENETLSYTCSWCDDANYARVGTPKYNAWQNRIAAFQPTAAKAQPSSSGLLV